MAAPVGQLVLGPQDSWRLQGGDYTGKLSSPGLLSFSWSLSNPGVRLGGLKHVHCARKRHAFAKCIAFSDDVKVLDGGSGGSTIKPGGSPATDGDGSFKVTSKPATAGDASLSKPVTGSLDKPVDGKPDASGRGSVTLGNVEPLKPAKPVSGDDSLVLKAAPKPMAPPVRPKPAMVSPPNGSNINQARKPGTFSQSSRGNQGPVQNVEKILESAEKLSNPSPSSPSPRPTFNRQQSFQQPGNPSFKARWVKGDPTTSTSPNPTTNRPGFNGATTRPQGGTVVPRTDQPRPAGQPPFQPRTDQVRAPFQPRTDQARPVGQAQFQPRTDQAQPVPRTDFQPRTTPSQPVQTPSSSPPVQGSSTPSMSPPPLMKPKPSPSVPQMSVRPVMTPRPRPAAPTPSTGPRLIDTFRRPVDPTSVAPPSTGSAKGGGSSGSPSSPNSPATTTPRTFSGRPVLGRKMTEDSRKRADASDGAKRRLAIRDENARDDAKEIGVNISGGSATRKGRKYSKARRKAERAEAARAAAPVKVEILEVGKQGMSVGDLADKLAVTDAEVVKTLFLKGIPVTVNQTLNEESVKIVCEEFEVEVIEAGFVKVEEMATKRKEFLDEEDLDSLELRPPVVTVMGHVDHGKTSLLDYIRKSKVAAGEAGGITQAIGAYQVPVEVDGETQTCVFLDTPGHQAFSAMRARGARVTDIAVIVVAADDGIRPQTVEAVAHAKAAKVPIVVAINKIDKDGANVDRVKEELSKISVVPPEWGGDEQMVPVSALTGENVDSLLETIMLVAELQDLRANPSRRASGTILEAALHKSKGPIATLLVQNGTLKKGDVVLCGESYGKVRAMFDDRGRTVSEAGPSAPVRVIGLSDVPVAGDEFSIVDTIDEARESAGTYADRMRDERLSSLASEGKVTLASLANAVSAGKDIGVESQQLNIVLRVDVQGSVEAIREALQVLPQDAVQLRFLMQATGEITSSDIDLAIASKAIVIGFNVRLQPSVKEKADNEGVEIRLYKVIYDLIDDMRQAMEGLLKPIEEEVPIGKAEVRASFSAGSGRVGGCMVVEGKLVKGCGVHIKRGRRNVHTGTLSSLRRVKELAKEVEAGLECGVGVDNFNEWQEGDLVLAFDKVQKKRTLEDASASVTAALAEPKS